MPKFFIRLLLLTIVMLTHAAFACESTVMHLPAENHSLSMLDANTGHDIVAHAEHHQGHALDYPHEDESDDEHHSPHAHVTCYVTNLYHFAASPILDTAIISNAFSWLPISYSPPVPPPNA
ncbi:hypothetical protein [Pseudoalteromonas tunicata]|jgi:hypothetical protein|uniref:Orphan protein n=1 Tax=Pseudoalteromonas tunicata D2 TaxID=87626 RepID=A4C6L1_9GAMM|nr:hypothetical protein [Pseudoalteromonas tunicata]EAR29615.1 hypothetical protein PTD2_12384 [Pseudoalteromonas tunicata D2]